MERPNPSRKYATPLDEIVDRMRRIETRFTKYLEERGFETQTKPCVFVDGCVVIPNINASLKDILAAKPAAWGVVPVKLGGRIIAHVGGPDA